MKSRVIDCAMCQAFVTLMFLSGVMLIAVVSTLFYPPDPGQFLMSFFAAFVAYRVACVVLESRT